MPWGQLPAPPLTALQRPGPLSSVRDQETRRNQRKKLLVVFEVLLQYAGLRRAERRAALGVLGTQTALPDAGATLSSVRVGFLSLATKKCPRTRNSFPEQSL